MKNVYNLYVYFWRWALWKTFEHTSASGPGVVSYISAASYLDGDAFVGMREHLRRLCDEVWIIDLGGEGRGTRREENVFAIQTPVAIAIAACYSKPTTDQPAAVHYTRIDGERDDKLAKLEAIRDFNDLGWQSCPTEWQAPFRPAGVGSYFDWPLLINLMPWQHSGVQLKRTWPVAPDEDTLRQRWRALLKAEDRRAAFRESGDRVVNKSYGPILRGQERQKPISQLPASAPVPPIERYAYRSFDRQWVIADGRLIARPRPELWNVHGGRQVYLTTLINHPLGDGPAVTAAADVPDLHHFRGSYGAREAIPLYRDADGSKPNLMPGLLTILADVYGGKVQPEDLLAYFYAVLAQPAFTHRFHDELLTRELRVPLTKDRKLFERAVSIGRRLVWLHTYAQRLSGPGRPKGKVPGGKAKCVDAVPDKTYPKEFKYDAQKKRLLVGLGVFAPVEPEVFEYEVSGYKVVQSWLGYRIGAGRGKKSSSLDDIRPERWTAQFTTELLELLWVLEHTVEAHAVQKQLLEEILAGPLVLATELPAVPDAMKSPPGEREGQLFDMD